jgi:hypothetical protein
LQRAVVKLSLEVDQEREIKLRLCLEVESNPRPLEPDAPMIASLMSEKRHFEAFSVLLEIRVFQGVFSPARI